MNEGAVEGARSGLEGDLKATGEDDGLNHTECDTLS